MKWFTRIAVILLGAYSISLFVIELRFGQEYVRGFFSDIVVGKDYPLPYCALYGINTTMTVVMLAAIALLFLVCAGKVNHASVPICKVWFQWSQVFFFLYLACDDRLLIHEKMGSLLHIDDSLVMAALGFVELVLLLLLGKVLRQPWRLKGWLLAAAACFAVMVFVDGLFPTSTLEQLVLEDLSKTWSIVFLLLYAWRYCMDSVNQSSHEGSDGT